MSSSRERQIHVFVQGKVNRCVRPYCNSTSKDIMSSLLQAEFLLHFVT